jgi:SAM-dependent methyltransferase
VEVGRQHERDAARVQPATELCACPVCGAAEHRRFVVVFGFHYDTCDDCGHLFLQNPPGAAAIEALYQSHDSVQRQVYVGEQQFADRARRIARPKLDFCLESIPPGGVWMDVGCGTGELLSLVGDHGFRALGIEADPAQVAFARQRGIEIVAEYCSSPRVPPGRDVAVVSALNVLEHQLDPRSWLAELCAGLPAGGHLVVEVPRHPSVSSFSCQLHPQLASRHIYPPDHLHVFSERSLERLLDACGLEARAVWVFGQDFQELLYASAASAGIDESPFFHQLLDAVGPAQQALDDQDLSDVLLVVARKR